MPRMRSIKPEFWADEDLAVQLSRDARLLYVGLWNLADEHSRLRGDPRFIKGQLLPYDDDLGPVEIDRLLDEIAAAGKLKRYIVGGRSYLHLRNLGKHQRLEAEKVPSRLPGPDEADPHSDTSEQARHSDADESKFRANSSEHGANELSLKHVAGSREHVAELSSDADESEPNREDVDRICRHLADRIKVNGCKRPTITRKWRNAARLMLDRDGRTEAEVTRAIDWCQDHEFWRSNILSMPKLREKYDQLRLAAQREQHPRDPPRRSTTDERVAGTLALARRYEEDDHEPG